MIFCRKCGNEIPNDGAFCPNCGTPASIAQKSVLNETGSSTSALNDQTADGYSVKNRTCALILSILLGGYGAHNFYLGNTSRALGQLLPMLFGIIGLSTSGFALMREKGAGIILYLISYACIIIPTVTAIIDIVHIAKGTAEDGHGLLVKNWGNNTSASSDSSVKVELPQLKTAQKKTIADKLFFIFPLVIGLVIMFTPANDRFEYMRYHVIFSYKYVTWSLILSYSIMALGTFGFGFDFKKGLLMGLGAAVGSFPLLRMCSLFCNASVSYVLKNFTKNNYNNYYSYNYFEEIFDIIKDSLRMPEMWRQYFISILFLLAVPVAMSFIAMAVRKHNEAKAK